MTSANSSFSIGNYESRFVDGKLPNLVYITQQKYDSKELIRPMHSHDNIAELLLVYEGSGNYNVDNEFHKVKKGDILLYNVGTLHEVTTDSDENIGTFCFGITNIHLKGLPVNHLTTKEDGFVRHSNEYFEEMLSMCHLIFTTLNLEKPFTREFCRHLTIAFMLISLGFSKKTSRSMGSEDYILVDRIKGYIDENFREDISISHIASSLNISASYASHIFKAATGYSIKKYLSRRRIGEAETQLLSSDATITEIAMMVGFNDSNYFNTVFSKTVGFTPRQYRKAYSETLRGIHTQ